MFNFFDNITKCIKTISRYLASASVSTSGVLRLICKKLYISNQYEIQEVYMAECKGVCFEIQRSGVRFPTESLRFFFSLSFRSLSFLILAQCKPTMNESVGTSLIYETRSMHAASRA